MPQNPRKNKKPSHKTTHSSKIHTITAEPVFGQPAPSPDPAGFKDPVTDQKEKELATLGEVPAPSGGAIEPVLTLEQVYGSAGAAKVQAIQQTGQLVFHCVGDTGSVVGPGTQSLVADKMVTDFARPARRRIFPWTVGPYSCWRFSLRCRQSWLPGRAIR